MLRVLFITGYDVPCNIVSRYFSDLPNFYLYLIPHILEFSLFSLNLEIFTFYAYCFTLYEVSLYCSNLLLKHFFFSFLFLHLACFYDSGQKIHLGLLLLYFKIVSRLPVVYFISNYSFLPFFFYIMATFS